MRGGNPLAGFEITADGLSFLGDGLTRPESILVDDNGLIWVSDLGGTATVAADGSVTRIARATSDDPSGLRSIPNGIAMAADGTVLIANVGLGRLERMGRDGRTQCLLDAIDGQSLGSANFVLRDGDTLWLTVSTRTVDWFAALGQGRIKDGYVVRIDEGGARVVADGLAFTNECRIDAAHHFLYVAETFGCRITRFPLLPGAALGKGEAYGPADLGGFPDGIAFDGAGNLWVTLLGSNRIVAIAPEGDVFTILQLGRADAWTSVKAAFVTGNLTTRLLMSGVDPVAPAVSSIAFGGPDRRNVYLGSLMGTRIPWFRVPAGLAA